MRGPGEASHTAQVRDAVRWVEPAPAGVQSIAQMPPLTSSLVQSDGIARRVSEDRDLLRKVNQAEGTVIKVIAATQLHWIASRARGYPEEREPACTPVSPAFPWGYKCESW
jgi:hypothetical protein